MHCDGTKHTSSAPAIPSIVHSRPHRQHLSPQTAINNVPSMQETQPGTYIITKVDILSTAILCEIYVSLNVHLELTQPSRHVQLPASYPECPLALHAVTPACTPPGATASSHHSGGTSNGHWRFKKEPSGTLPVATTRNSSA